MYWDTEPISFLSGVIDILMVIIQWCKLLVGCSGWCKGPSVWLPNYCTVTMRTCLTPTACLLGLSQGEVYIDLVCQPQLLQFDELSTWGRCISRMR